MGGKPRKKPSPEVEMTRIIQADALNELANAAARKFVEITSEPPRHIPVGVNSIRTKREAMEQAYAHQWIIENNPAQSNTILEMIISTGTWRALSFSGLAALSARRSQRMSFSATSTHR